MHQWAAFAFAKSSPIVLQRDRGWILFAALFAARSAITRNVGNFAGPGIRESEGRIAKYLRKSGVTWLPQYIFLAKYVFLPSALYWMQMCRLFFHLSQTFEYDKPHDEVDLVRSGRRLSFPVQKICGSAFMFETEELGHPFRARSPLPFCLILSFDRLYDWSLVNKKA